MQRRIPKSIKEYLKSELNVVSLLEIRSISSLLFLLPMSPVRTLIDMEALFSH